MSCYSSTVASKSLWMMAFQFQCMVLPVSNIFYNPVRTMVSIRCNVRRKGQLFRKLDFQRAWHVTELGNLSLFLYNL
ncbi:UNVERIFIED_CONTAM: hypothetical protein FKN15_021611 [Acipenser sinensis]